MLINQNSLFPINHITYPWCCDMIILAYIRCILQYRISNYFCVHFFFFSRYQYIILRPYPNVNNLIIITLFYLVQGNYAMLIIALHTAANMAAALTKEWAQSRPTKKRRTTVRRISSRCRSYRLPQSSRRLDLGALFSLHADWWMLDWHVEEI